MRSHRYFCLTIWIILLLGILITSTSCRNTRHEVTHSFYYWKSEFNLSQVEKTTLKQSNIKRIYIKFFDVVWDKRQNRPSPVSMIVFQTPIPDSVSIVPTVYLTNETLQKLPMAHLHDLARGISGKIAHLLRQNGIKNYREIQLDCDWTDTTWAQYFALIRAIKDYLPSRTIVSATIRLHQIKFRGRTGIPPVDRGVLMFYNLSYPGSTVVTNSIIDLKIGRAYLDTIADYPLPLDVALPLYSWGVLFQGRQYRGLINNLTIAELQHNPNFSRDRNFFIAKRNTYIKHTYIYKNDRIRVDESRYQDVSAAARYLSPLIKTKRFNVILFHLDRHLLRRFPDEKLQTIFCSFN